MTDTQYKLFGWDRELDYNKTYKQLVNKLKELRDKNTARATAQLAYTIVLLTQLRNGCRVGEAIDAVYNIARNFTRETEVTVEKRKDGATRKIVLPEEVTKNDIMRIGGFIINEYEQKGKKRLVRRVGNYARRTFDFNTHALRYAFITQLARQGVSAQLIAKMTMHKRLDYIVYYTQKLEAEEILRNLNNSRRGGGKR